MSYRIGIDVGGTNTYAVLMDGRQVLAEFKTLTTPEVTGGIVAALSGLQRARPFPPEQVSTVMIGTTHFTNAVVEAQRLAPTATLRLGLPATAALPPMTDWPDRLPGGARQHRSHCPGGHRIERGATPRIERKESPGAGPDNPRQ